MPTENLQQSAEILIYTRKEGDEPCFELTCTVVARFPLDKRSGYQRQLVWQDKDELRVWKVPYYDRKDSHLKTLTLGEYKQYLDRYWQAGK